LLISSVRQKAAEQGYAKAQSNLGAMYDFGKGVLKDDKQSAYWYQDWIVLLHILAQLLFDTKTQLA
jgi:hypothetical protein